MVLKSLSIDRHTVSNTIIVLMCMSDRSLIQIGRELSIV